MSRHARVSLSDPAADHPRPLGATAIALCALCAGVASAYGLRDVFDDAPEARPEAARRTHTPHAGRVPSPAHAQQAPSLAGSEVAASEPLASTAAIPHAGGAAPSLLATPTAALSTPPSDQTAPLAGNAAASTTSPLAPTPVGAPAPAPASALTPTPASVPTPASATAATPASATAATLAPATAATLAPATAPALAAAAAPATVLTSAPAVAPAASPAPSPAAIAATPATSLDASAHAQLTFKHGLVAYLRCDGLPQHRGPFPCPRDREMEKRVWSALLELEHCAPPELRNRRGDLRIEFTPDATTWTTVAEVDRSAVVRCAGAALARVGTSLRPTRMIVSFRFELQ